jgi:hypothetical protein
MRTIRLMSDSRVSRHTIRGLVIIAVGGILTTAMASPAVAEEGNIKESQATFSLYRGPNDTITVPTAQGLEKNCRGTVRIAQTSSNSIEATSSVTCTKNVGVNRNRVEIHAGSPAALASNDNGCDNCRTYTIATSIQNAAHGTKYCALGEGILGFQYTYGSGSACIIAA